jgi:transposase-like protein
VTGTIGPEERERALIIARELGAAEASRGTGIRAGTIRSWLSRERRRGGVAPAAQTPRRPQKLRAAHDEVTEEAMARVRSEAAEYVAGRLREVADRLYRMGEQALERIEEMLAAIGATDWDRDLSSGLRALVGAMHYGFRDAQLLAGKPTGRIEGVGELARRIGADPALARGSHDLLQRAHGEAGPH